MLPDDFKWFKPLPHMQVETAMGLHATEVARLIDRLDGSWFVRLECWHGVNGPLVTRNCTSFEQGRAGVEEWVRRNEDRIRAEVRARRPKHWADRDK